MAIQPLDEPTLQSLEASAQVRSGAAEDDVDLAEDDLPEMEDDEGDEGDEGDQGSDESDLSSGDESAYEEDEDLDRPVHTKSTKKKPGRPKKDVPAEPSKENREGRGRGRGKGKGKGRQTRDEADEDDDIFDALAGFVGRVPRGGSVIPDRGVLHPDEAEAGPSRGGGAKKRTKKRRARPAHQPTHEVTLLLSESNLAFITGDEQKAIDGYLEVIRLDPYVYSAWTSLGTIYSSIGNHEAARQMRFCGLHIEGDAEGWRQLAGEYQAIGQLEESLYCLRKTLAKDPQDVMALWDISALYKSMGKASRALDAFKRLLKYDPDTRQDFSLLADLYSLAIETRQYRFAAESLRFAYDWHLETFSGPDDPENPEDNTMTLENVVNLAELLLRMDELEEVIVVIRRGQRWFQGRAAEKQWDTMEDDREYDPPGVSRWTEAQKKANKKREDEGLEVEVPERYPLDTALRHRLALVRLRLGNDAEALIHADEVLRLDAETFSTMFVELGKALMARQLWSKALQCFEMLQACDEIDDTPENVMALGICLQQTKQNARAVEALRWVAEVDPDNLDARLKLANVLEETGHKAEALEIVTDVIRTRAEEAAVTRTRGPTIDKPKQTRGDKAASAKLTHKILEDQMRQRMQSMWDDVQSAELGIAEGDIGALDSFIYAAGTMIENFRLAKSNFKKNRGVYRVVKLRKFARPGRPDIASKAQEMHDRLERTLGLEDGDANDGGEKYTVVRMTQFYGLGAEDWLALVIKYCCVLMIKNEEDLAMEILEHVMWAGLFNNRRCEVALRLTVIACAMRTKAYLKIANNCRRLSQMHQFRTEPYFIMLACIGGGGIPAFAAWQDLRLQKFLHRELMIYDAVVKGYKFHFSTSNGRWAQEIKSGLTSRLGDAVPVDDEHPDAEAEDEPTGGVRGQSGVAWRRGTRIPLGDAMDDEDPMDVDGENDDATADVDADAGADIDDDADMAEEDEGRDEVDMGLGEVPVKPTKFSPMWNYLYGISMLNSKSYQTALFYLLRAYEHDRYHPLLCLCIAHAYLGRSMNRQADDRNFFIAHGMAFLSRYRKLSPKDSITLEEIDYNYGRAFHSIGVTHLAVKHYEKVLESVQTRIKEYDDVEDREQIRRSSLAMEAAHNLMLLYATNNSMSLVRERSKWLAI